MDHQRKRRMLRAVILVAQLPPDFSEYQKYVLSGLHLLCRLPPDPLLDVRNRLLPNSDVPCTGRNVFSLVSDRRYEFFEITGESPETFLELVNIIPLPSKHDNILSKRNRILLVMLRTYHSYRLLAVLFNVSVTNVQEEIKRALPVFDASLSYYINWPCLQEWDNLRGNWAKIDAAVGAIDGTSHEIYRPIVNQQQYYSGHRHYHCLHTQVIVDNTGKIVYIESGFMGHQNDAQQFGLMRQIGVELPFTDNCFLFGDKIFPNRHPVLTPYSAAQLRRKHGEERRQCLRFNRYIGRYRVLVEHAIGEIKCYRSVSTVWRHPRRLLARTVQICAALVCRRKQIGLIM